MEHLCGPYKTNALIADGEFVDILGTKPLFAWVRIPYFTSGGLQDGQMLVGSHVIPGDERHVVSGAAFN
jgi:hypothetical protein